MEDAPGIRRYTDFEEMKAGEYRYWQSRPAHERLDAVEEMIEIAYELKGWEIEPDVPRLQRPVVRLPCPWFGTLRGGARCASAVRLQALEAPPTFP
jgi:hypothetical protein